MPIVFVGVVDPVELGLVPNLVRPAGNITGLSTNAADVAGKRLELLWAIIPKLRRVAVVWHPANPTNPLQLKGAQVAARTLGVRLVPVSVKGPNDFDSAVATVRGTDGVLMLESPFFTTHRARLAKVAARSRLRVLCFLRSHAGRDRLLICVGLLGDMPGSGVCELPIAADEAGRASGPPTAMASRVASVA